MTETTVSETLNRAADLIEERGWSSGNGWVTRLDEVPHALCLEGAIQSATAMTMYEPYRQCPAYRAVRDYLDDRPPFMWNDDLRFTDDHRWVGDSPEAAHEYASRTVVEVLRACAVIEASRERESVSA